MFIQMQFFLKKWTIWFNYTNTLKGLRHNLRLKFNFFFSFRKGFICVSLMIDHINVRGKIYKRDTELRINC